MEHKDIGLGQIHGIANVKYDSIEDMKAAPRLPTDEFKVASVAEDEGLYVLANKDGMLEWRPLFTEPEEPLIIAETTDTFVFGWHPNSDTTTGQSLDDFGAFGTGSYSAIGNPANAAHDTLFSDATHQFVSANDTYSSAGMASANPVMLMPELKQFETHVFEAAYYGWYKPGATMTVGLCAERGQATGNFSGTDKGIVASYNSGDTGGGATWKVRAGNGTAVTSNNANSLDLNLEKMMRIQITLGWDEDRQAVGAKVMLTRLAGGGSIFWYEPSQLPPPGTLLYAVVATGTGGTAQQVQMNISNAKFVRKLG